MASRGFFIGKPSRRPTMLDAISEGKSMSERAALRARSTPALHPTARAGHRCRSAFAVAVLGALFAATAFGSPPPRGAADGSAASADASPFAHVPAQTRDALEKVRPVTAKHAMVVSDQHFATEAGVKILEEGGNAIDAAVAVGYALAVTQPCCGTIGGGGDRKSVV